ncbi:MAG: OsmC family protein [Proteobacteria bacterium]|nr:OsmC family protein [Pseudomonadota bacterium]
MAISRSATPKLATYDRELAAILGKFVQHVASAEHPVERASVRVRRAHRFTHDVETLTGLTCVIDEPADVGGGGSAPDPAELLLAAVGASLSVTMTAHAALRGLAIDSIDMHLTCEMNPKVFLKPRARAPNGIMKAQIEVELVSPMSLAEARALFSDALLASPVFRSLKRQPRVTLKFRRRR